MAAGMHIHVLGGVDKNVVMRFSSTSIGSKYFEIVPYKESQKHRSSDFDAVAETPNVWVGSVSWLKAGLTGNNEAYIPDIVNCIYEIVGEDFRVIDNEFINEIKEAFDNYGNTTMYEVASKEHVIDFLTEHFGDRVFTISW